MYQKMVNTWPLPSAEVRNVEILKPFNMSWFLNKWCRTRVEGNAQEQTFQLASKKITKVQIGFLIIILELIITGIVARATIYLKLTMCQIL